MNCILRVFIFTRQNSCFATNCVVPFRALALDPNFLDPVVRDRSQHSYPRSLSTESPATEATIDARSLVGGHVTSAQVPVPVSTPMPPIMSRGGRRVSAAVMALQLKMHKLLSQNKFREAVKIFENFVNEGFKEAEKLSLVRGMLPINQRPGEYQWLQYLQALSKGERIATKQITAALQLMRQVGIPPRNIHYFHLLQALRRQGISYRACEVIDEMIKSGVRPSTSCYEQAILACLTNRDLDSTSMLLDNHFRSPTWHANDFQVGLLLYTKVISFCANLKRIENALIFMRQMADLQLTIPVHLRLEVISNAAEVDDTAAVDSVLRDLHSLRTVFKLGDGTVWHVPVRIDEGILLSVLNCAARTGHTFLADQAWSILHDCVRLPFPHELMDAVRVTSHLAAAPVDEEPVVEEEKEDDKEKEDEEGEEDDMEDHKHEEGIEVVKRNEQSTDNWEETLHHLLHNSAPMVESYHAFIEAQAKGGNVERAFEALLEMEEHYPDNPQDLSPAQGLCMLADELAKDANTVDQAYFVLDEWHKNGKKVTVAMLDVIVAACSRMGDANRAFETFEAYSTLGLTHRTESYNALMEVCASQRQVEVIMKLLQEMTKAGVKPNVDTYMQIMEGYINNGDTKGIAHALTITCREGFMPTLRVLDRAYQCAHRYNDENAKSMIRRELLALGYRFDLQLRGRGGGRRMRGRFSGRGGPFRGGNNQRDHGAPVQTYVGSPRQPPSTDSSSNAPNVA